MFGYEEHCAFSYSSDEEWDRAEASELGEANPDRAWVLSNRDVWYPNPRYKGEPVEHPEYEGEYNPPVKANYVPSHFDEDIPF